MHPTPDPRTSESLRPGVGTLLPVLREDAWPHGEASVRRRLLVGPGQGLLGPWVTFGYDTPRQVSRVSRDALETRTLEELEAEALRNLAARVPRIVEQGGVVELRDEYAAEMLLLPERMREIGARLKTELFLVSVPQEGSLLAVSATAGPNAVCKLARETFDGSKRRRISPMPVVISQGVPVGFATVQPFVPLSEITEISGGPAPREELDLFAEPDPFAEPEEPERPWWRFW